MNQQLTKGDVLEQRYRILYQIGEGGMGVVHAAEHIHLHKKCAIKVLHPSEANNAQMIKRFKIEAQASANIRHPNVVEVMDYGITPDNRPFFVMEYLVGESLADRLNRDRAIDEAAAKDIAVQVLKGLAAAHRMRIVHRDLKPENIYLSRNPDDEEVVKILDFGISKIVTGTASMPPSPVSAPHKALTQQGVVFGTPGYMAPESLFGTQPVDSRADLFSISVLLFEMVTGTTPFRGKDAHATMLATASQEAPRPSSIEPRISESLEKIILKGLEKDPGKRFQKADEFLAAIIKTNSIPQDPAPAPVSPCTSPAPRPGLGGFTRELQFSEPPEKAERLSLDDIDFPPRRPAHRASTRFQYPPPRQRNNLRTAAKRISIAFSPIPLIFFLGLGGGVYYYFIRQDPIRVAGYEDPIDRKIQLQSQEPDHTPPSMAAPVPIETVTIWIDTSPKNVEIAIDGKPAFERPLIVPKGSDKVEMRFTAPGYREQILKVVPDREQTLTAKLKRKKNQNR